MAAVVMADDGIAFDGDSLASGPLGGAARRRRCLQAGHARSNSCKGVRARRTAQTHC